MAWSQEENEKRRLELERREAEVAAQVDGHYCADWDEMAVSAWTLEYDCCICYKKSLLGRVINWFVKARYDFYYRWKIRRRRDENS